MRGGESEKGGKTFSRRYYSIFIGPESDHWLCLSVTNSLRNCLVNLIDVTLACEDANSKLEVVTVADVSDEDRVERALSTRVHCALSNVQTLCTKLL